MEALIEVLYGLGLHELETLSKVQTVSRNREPQNTMLPGLACYRRLTMPIESHWRCNSILLNNNLVHCIILYTLHCPAYQWQPHVTSLIAKPRLSHNDRRLQFSLFGPDFRVAASPSPPLPPLDPPVCCPFEIALDRCCPPVVVRVAFFQHRNKTTGRVFFFFSFACVDSF